MLALAPWFVSLDPAERMSSAAFTPKQIAEALGVSESSVKRWADSGRLNAARTVGGHRKVPVASLIDFVRQTGHEVVNPQVIGLAPVSRRARLETLQDDLYSALIGGDEAACRGLVLGAYQRGESIADLGDRLIGPVFGRVGAGWEAGQVAVREERRSCEVTMATLHELRRWLAPAPAEAPLAVVATPEADFAEVPPRLVELVLVAAGWRVVVAGSGLPLEEVRDAVLGAQPRLMCLSVTHLERPKRFVEECNQVLMRPLAATSTDSRPVARVVGGGALQFGDAARLECELHARNLSDLVAFEEGLRSPG